MYGYERVCNLLEEEEQKQNKRNSKMKKKNRPTHADRKKFIFDNKENTLISIYLSLSCYLGTKQKSQS